MGKKRTEKSKYQSKYSPQGWVTGQQYIIERLCENKARSQKMGELPIKFWELEEWSKFYKSQLRQCHKLFKQYGEIPVIRAIIKNPKGKNIWSLHAKWLIPILVEEQAKYQVEQAAIKPVSHERVENPVVQQKKISNKLLEGLD